MHIDPSPELAEQYQDALKNLKIKEKVQGNNSIDNEIINRNDDLCGICYRVPIGAVFTPCMHCEICARCAFRSTRFNGLCPFCRSVNEILIFQKIERVFSYENTEKVEKKLEDEYIVTFKDPIQEALNDA